MAALVEPGETVMLDAGSTTLHIAALLRNRRDITVVTNAVNIARELSGGEMEVTITGGTLRSNTLAMAGPIAGSTLAGLHVDRLFLATNGVDLKRGLSTQPGGSAGQARDDRKRAGGDRAGRPQQVRLPGVLQFLRAGARELQRGVPVRVSAAGRLAMIATATLNPAIDKTMSIPGFAIGRTNRATVERIDAGGKGINVAKAVSHLGVPVKAPGFLGGNNGRLICETLAGSGIAADFVPVAGDTRVNLKIKDPLGGTETEINEPGFPAGGGEWRALLRKVEGAASECAVVVLSGSLPPGLRADTYQVLVRAARRRGARTGSRYGGTGAPVRARRGTGFDQAQPARGRRVDRSK